ncbi:MAG: hypothetical protein LBR22_08325 [Desulfovibrio sp.]|nr:hypothetical protein [Desulfovibrio sp.]
MKKHALLPPPSRGFIAACAMSLFLCGYAPAHALEPAQQQYASSETPWPAYLQQPGHINRIWMERGGARIPWNGTWTPRQLYMNGAPYRDPALVPDLSVQPKKARPAVRKKKAVPAQPSVEKPVEKAPEGVGKTALKAPEPAKKPEPEKKAEPAPKPAPQAAAPAPKTDRQNHAKRQSPEAKAPLPSPLPTPMTARNSGDIPPPPTPPALTPLTRP